MDNLMKNILEGTPQEVIDRYSRLPEAAKRTDFGEYDANIVVLDTETTGVSLKRDELTQIAAAKLDHGEITEWFVTFVNPGQPIPDEIQHLTNIADSDVSDAPSPEEALCDLVEFVGDAKIVAHNAYFDRNFVTKHPAGYPLLENQWIDSLDLSRISLPRMKSHRLIDLVKAFGAPLSTHRADDDVVATCALYRILLAAVDAMPEGLVQEIANLAPVSEWFTARVFRFFAERKLLQRERAEFTQEQLLSGLAAVPASFSLHTVRRDRVSAFEGKPKPDAANMVSAELMERMKSSGATLTISNSSSDSSKVVEFPSADAIEQAFAEDGMIGGIYPDYEQRTEQLEMALAVRDAMADALNLMVEAGTGTGKSMAYLVPAALTAKQNNIGIGVATKTNALLDQLCFKELPALASTFEDGLSYVALKGYTHYPCLLRINRILREGVTMREVGGEEKSQAPAMAALLSYIEQTEYGDIDNLKIDYRTLPRWEITTTSRDCLKHKCPFYGAECFVHGLRERAECADIVVTNHTLFFYDIEAENSLLPPIRYWVVDEAHGAEEEARSALSPKLSIDDLDRLASRLVSENAKKNPFLNAEHKLPDEPSLFHGLLSKAVSAARDFAEAEADFAFQSRELLFFDPQKKSSYELFDLRISDDILTSGIFKELVERAKVLVGFAEKVVNVSQDIVSYLEDVKGAGQVQREIASVALELKEIIGSVDVIFINPSDRYVCAATLNRREKAGAREKQTRGGVKFQALLYNVGTTLDETLYSNTKSVTFTSATLTVDGSFKAFEEAMGLNTSPQSKCAELMLDSCYDFDSNMTVYIATDMPEPNSSHYHAALNDLLVGTHKAQQGSMLTLFTNRKDMENCFDSVRDELSEAGLRILCQRKGVSRKNLSDEFMKDETVSLFALKSFWEGFDAPGDTLKGVIIPKLPFASPHDPLYEERDARDSYAWFHYVLPKSILEVRQAAGRLIRKASDQGVLILADSRLLTKRYGATVINSLPSRNVKRMTIAEICSELQV